MRIKGAIFDMDGTLVDSLSFWEHLWRRIGERYLGDGNFQAGKEQDRRVRTMIYRDAMDYIREYYGIKADGDEFFDFCVESISDFYKNVAKAKPGAALILKHLKERGVVICLASATAMREIRTSLASTGLEEYFDLILSCADMGVGKEKPDVYLEALRQMGLKKEDVCVVEDSYVALESAKGAGLKTVGIYDRHSYNQDRLRDASDIYLGEGHTLAELEEIFVV